VATLACEEEGALAVLILGSAIRACLEQELCNHVVALLARPLQWCPAAVVRTLRRGTACQQGAHEIGVAAHRREGER
jgi:hypothetical protein